MTKKNFPRLIISGLNGSSGKTTVSLGLARILSNKGYSIKTFKKGPDYIDSAWLAYAAQTPQGNLDLYFTKPKELVSLFHTKAHTYDACIIEGNRGLFDGIDAQGTYSTSVLAHLLKSPVILVLDCTKMTRTAAAIIHGCNTFEAGTTLAGVILNRVGTKRQELLIRESLQNIVPVLGALPRRDTPFIQERYMGLTSVFETENRDYEVEVIAEFIASHVNIEKVWEIATAAPELEVTLPAPLSKQIIPTIITQKRKTKEAFIVEKIDYPIHRNKPTIGYVYDAAFWFYYHENLQALVELGAHITPISLLSKEKWTKIDGLYIGGGLPERFAKELSDQKKNKTNVASMAKDGLPIYAECGGLVYLSKNITIKETSYPMSNIFPLEFNLADKPTAHGYTEATVVQKNPFHPIGSSFRGHEFHFSYCNSQFDNNLVLEMRKGEGIGKTEKAKDGLLFEQTFASYMHIYAPSVSHWAKNFINVCLGKTT